MASTKEKLFRALTIAVAVVTVAAALYIMVFRLGLSDKFDFGAGAYFYADHPDLQDAADAASYTSSVPKWLYYVLFFGWGYIMWRFWIWIDRRS